MSHALLVIVLLTPIVGDAQQVADTGYLPPVTVRADPTLRGPLVLLDEAHHNFHTVAGRYAPFVKLLQRDGYVVRPNRTRFSRASLKAAKVLVIANAIAGANEQRWSLPILPAFTDDEVAEVREWVREGGSLLLVADHMPFAGAAEKLALEFGAVFLNGFATDSTGGTGPIRFRRSDQSLGSHRIVRGRRSGERVDSVMSFTGQAFRLTTGGGIPLMVLPRNTTVLLPAVAWQFSDSTPRVRGDWMLQGAAIEFGRGRIVILGEAAMLSAQVQGPDRRPFGMNHPGAPQNAQFTLNIVHWLARQD
ncbi:MAG: hypothetical protein ACRENU_03670 [Gemmatimonadaceae bacterium]